MSSSHTVRTGPRGPVRFLGASALAFVIGLFGCGPEHPEADPRVVVTGAETVIDLKDFGEARGGFYHYVTASGKKVDILVCRLSSGEYRAYLDACRECYRWRKGYRIEGDTVVCRRCDERFEIDRMEEGRGSCIPIALPSSVREGRIIIPTDALENARKYF